MMNEKKHPFYDHSISEFFLAKRDGKVVGKLSMLINRPFNEYHGTKDSEFYFLIASTTRKWQMLCLILPRAGRWNTA
jgi:hypothetical protein